MPWRQFPVFWRHLLSALSSTNMYVLAPLNIRRAALITIVALCVACFSDSNYGSILLSFRDMTTLAVWLSGNALASIIVALRQNRLVPG